jgi:hypothetical protein
MQNSGQIQVHTAFLRKERAIPKKYPLSVKMKERQGPSGIFGEEKSLTPAVNRFIFPWSTSPPPIHFKFEKVSC